MKVDRLIGIVTLLLQNEKMTAPELASRFEVSRRTINRDIEDICKAGIPIVTTQGVGGGISIMEGYSIDKTLFTSAEIQAIFSGLKSLDSISENNKYKQLMDKLSCGKSDDIIAANHIEIDLSSWYKSTLAPKIEIIQNAIDQSKIVQFEYYSPSREGKRNVEPYTLVFKWSSWYLKGFCRDKNDFRLFKLNRMINLKCGEEIFKHKEYYNYEFNNNKIFSNDIIVKAIFNKNLKWRLIDEYGMESFTELEDGSILFEYGFMDKEWLFSWLLSFGDKVKLIEPEDLKEEFIRLTKNILKNYSH